MSANTTRYNLPRISTTNCFGIIDRLEIHRDVAILIGWAFNADSTLPILVSVLNSGLIIGQKFADEARPDVLAAGAPRETVGFQIPLKTTGEETQLSIQITVTGQDYIFGTINLKDKLPKQCLSRDDIKSVFQLLFHREPENEGAIIHQLDIHTEKSSLFTALFESPEFYEKNSDLIKVLHENKFK